MAVDSNVIAAAEKAMENIAEKIGAKIKAHDFSIDKLKAQTVAGDIKSGGKKVTDVTIPDAAINDFVEQIATKIDETSITSYNKTGWAAQIYAQIFNVMQPFKNITKSGYKITYSVGHVMEGVGTVSANVAWGNYTATLSWQNISEKTLQGYFDALKELNKDSWKEFRSALISDSVKVFKAIYGIGTTTLSEVFSDKIIKTVTKAEFLNYVKKLAPNDKVLANQVKAYENLSKKYSALKNATNSNFESKAKDFLTACNALEKDLEMTATALSDTYSLSLTYDSANKKNYRSGVLQKCCCGN